MIAEPFSTAQSSVIRYHTLDSDLLYGWNIDISEILFIWQSLATPVTQSHWHCGLRTYLARFGEHGFVWYDSGVPSLSVPRSHLDLQDHQEIG